MHGHAREHVRIDMCIGMRTGIVRARGLGSVGLGSIDLSSVDLSRAGLGSVGLSSVGLGQLVAASRPRQHLCVDMCICTGMRIDMHVHACV